MDSNTDETEQTKKEDQLRTQNAKKQVLVNLQACLCVVTQACLMSDISRTQFYEWMKDEDFKNQVHELQNVVLDFAESALHQQIEKGIPSSTIFFLKTRGKKRGYIERIEHSGPDGEGLGLQINVSKKQNDEIDDLLGTMDKPEE